MSDKVRQAILDYHNQVRSGVAKGLYTIQTPRSGPNLSPAKRMYRLKYHCSLGNLHGNDFNRVCVIVHSNWHVGENIYASGDFSDMKFANLNGYEAYEDEQSRPLPQQADLVIPAGVLALFALGIPILIRSSPDVQVIAEPNGEAMTDKWPSDMSVAAKKYDGSMAVGSLPGSKTIKGPVFQSEVFWNDNDGQKEDRLPDTEEENNNENPSNHESDFGMINESCGGPMNNELRQLLLREHNKQRSIVAKGDYKIDAPDSGLQKLPPATRMYQLRYNCSLEKSALKWAEQAQCQMVHSQWDGIGENLYFMKGRHSTRASKMYAAKNAVSEWAIEIQQFGVERDIDEWTMNIGHATQVFWAETTTVGCGVLTCADGMISVVCHYYPPGNNVGEKWYTRGDTLSECGKPKKIKNIFGEIVGEEQRAMEISHPETGLCEILPEKSVNE